jgi:IS605 OrfB family transposase
MALKKQFNTIAYPDPQWPGEDGQPWLRGIHREAHAQPFAHLSKAWGRFFADLKARKPAHAPQFKKGRCRDSVYAANDKVNVSANTIRLPKRGDEPMRETLRCDGKIRGATVSRTADRGYVANKLTIRLWRENQAVVIEDWHVKGMRANDKLASALSDVGFGMFRSQIEYKSKRHRTPLVIADRWFPSTPGFGLRLEEQSVDLERPGMDVPGMRPAPRPQALNLKRLATETALPVASPSGNGGAAAGTVPVVAGKVMPVRYEWGFQDTSGQEKNRAHLRALS